MNLDPELDLWRKDWRAPITPPSPDLRGKVERQSRFMKFMLAMDIAVTIVIGGFVIAWAAISRDFDTALLAAATWVFIAVAWAFRLVNWRGQWAPSALDAAAFVDLSIRRCRARIASLSFGAVLYISELAFFTPWIYIHNHSRMPFFLWLFKSSWFLDFVWLFTAVFFALMIWWRRRIVAQLRYWRGLAGASGASPIDIE